MANQSKMNYSTREVTDPWENLDPLIRSMLVKAMIGGPSPRTLHIGYENAKGDESEREIEPYEVKGDTLFAWCMEREAMRQFKLERIRHAMMGKPFVPRAKGDGTTFQIRCPG